MASAHGLLPREIGQVLTFILQEIDVSDAAGAVHLDIGRYGLRNHRQRNAGQTRQIRELLDGLESGVLCARRTDRNAARVALASLTGPGNRILGRAVGTVGLVLPGFSNVVARIDCVRAGRGVSRLRERDEANGIIVKLEGGVCAAYFFRQPLVQIALRYPLHREFVFAKVSFAYALNLQLIIAAGGDADLPFGHFVVRSQVIVGDRPVYFLFGVPLHLEVRGQHPQGDPHPVERRAAQRAGVVTSEEEPVFTSEEEPVFPFPFPSPEVPVLWRRQGWDIWLLWSIGGIG